MSKVHLVLIKLKGVREREGIVVAREANVLLLVVVLKVGNVSAQTMPTTVLLLFGSC
jgi:hypothetical protein